LNLQAAHDLRAAEREAAASRRRAARTSSRRTMASPGTSRSRSSFRWTFRKPTRKSSRSPSACARRVPDTRPIPIGATRSPRG
jgi:hypothetical protein